MTEILIAGAGDVGTAAGLLLAQEGHTVWGLRRRPQDLPQGLRPFAADLSDPESLRNLPNVDVVLYTAAAGGFDEQAYQRTYVDGLRNVLAALYRPPSLLLFTSSTAVYGQTDGGWVDEDSPTEPQRFNGTLMLDAERVALGAGVPAVALRLAGIYGPGRDRLARSVRDGRAAMPAGPSFLNLIHREDAAGAVAHLTSQSLAGKTLEPVYVGVDNDPVDRRELLTWVANELGVSPPEPSSQGPGSRSAAHKRCRNSRLLATGYKLRYPSWREGYPGVLAAMTSP